MEILFYRQTLIKTSDIMLLLYKVTLLSIYLSFYLFRTFNTLTNSTVLHPEITLLSSSYGSVQMSTGKEDPRKYSRYSFTHGQNNGCNCYHPPMDQSKCPLADRIQGNIPGIISHREGTMDTAVIILLWFCPDVHWQRGSKEIFQVQFYTGIGLWIQLL